MKLKTFLQIFGAIAVLLTLIPLIAADFWWIRVFDFPHIQLSLLTLTAIAAYFIRFDIKLRQDYIFMIILLACFIFQFGKIYPYTPFSAYEIGESTKAEAPQLKILTANVLQENKKYEKLISEIDRINPDVMVFTETNTKWKNEISENLEESYRYNVEVPLQNTYGMLLYSKFELIDPQVRYLVHDSIPSIHTRIKLPEGNLVQLYAIHPTPPMPQHNPSSSDRDAEMMKIAKMSLERELPVIVIGDFNDVAWSETTSLFQSVGRLLDVRVGRGFYNTFNANNLLLRWPLDHILTSEEFRLKDINTGENTGSDHFPFYVSLSLEPDRAKEQEAEAPNENQLKRAKEQIKEEEEENVEKAKEAKEEN
ncbi:MAG TPA: endonuclease/exonuclease/phosphatase family protein [Salegentibacter sp.]|uniref:endonuclease/exonuclease/phosphatase family protein n=1 Tax=Salegentibacter sp. TaxID=1903072 RepID=UPI002F9250AC